MKTCEKCQIVNNTVWTHRQRTLFHDEGSNWVTLCYPCKVENDAYWDDMWADYNRECM